VLGPAIAALVATASIAPICGTVVGAILLAWSRGKLGRLLPSLVIAFAIAAFIFSPLLTSRYDQQVQHASRTQSGVVVPTTIAARWQVWTKQYFPLLSGRMLFGYGPEPPAQVQWQYTESVYVSMLLRGGVILLCVYLALMYALFKGARRIVGDEDPDRSALARVLAVSVVMLVFMHVVSSYFIVNGLGHLMWVLAALVFYEPAVSVSNAETKAPRAPLPRTAVQPARAR
jgi:hypothetical protein